MPDIIYSINHLFAAVGHTENGDEFIVGAQMPDGQMTVLVTGDKADVPGILAVAEQAAQSLGLEIQLIKFSQRELLETITPTERNER